MKIIGIYAGTFDPPTLGHVDIVKKALVFCDEVIVAVGTNTTKNPLLTPDERWRLWQAILLPLPQARAMTFQGLTANLAKVHGATLLIRGLRNSTDTAKEMEIAAANRRLGFETIFIPTSEEFAFMSSTIVREIALLGEGLDLGQYVPKAVNEFLKK